MDARSDNDGDDDVAKRITMHNSPWLSLDWCGIPWRQPPLVSRRIGSGGMNAGEPWTHGLMGMSTEQEDDGGARGQRRGSRRGSRQIGAGDHDDLCTASGGTNARLGDESVRAGGSTDELRMWMRCFLLVLGGYAGE
jgi:hypothetical protein